MNNLKDELVNLGVIDRPLLTLKIDDWFDNMKISFIGYNDKKVICEFRQCFEITLNHDKNYSKNIKTDKSKDYEYFVQDIQVATDKEIYRIKISAWPLEATIECKDVLLSFESK